MRYEGTGTKNKLSKEKIHGHKYCPFPPRFACSTRTGLSRVSQCRCDGEVTSTAWLHRDDASHGNARGRYIQNVLYQFHDRADFIGVIAVLITRSYAGQPGNFVPYSPIFDIACALLRGGKIKGVWKAELVSRKPDFEKLWATVGHRMIDAPHSTTFGSP